MRITCKVVGPGGEPVEWARVFFTEAPVPMPDIAALSDAEGRVVLTAPTAGRYRLQVAAEGLATREVELAVTDDEDIEKVLRMEPG